MPSPSSGCCSASADRALLAKAAELATAFVLLLVVFVLITGGHWYGSPTLFAPILLWTSLRFGIFPTAAAAVTIDLVAVMSAAYEAWPALFMAADTPEEIHSLQLFVLLVALPPLVVAVVVGERARARRQLDDALESMADAFALYDAQDRLVLCNARYPEFLSRIADLLVPGVRYEDLVREGVRRGLYPGVEPAQAEAWIADQVAAHRAGSATEVQLADGRWLHAIARPTADGGTVDVRRDITERKHLEEAIEHMAMHDPLTNLPNRAMFYRELERALARAEREPCRIAVILVDLDRFKEVNDTFGHRERRPAAGRGWQAPVRVRPHRGPGRPPGRRRVRRDRRQQGGARRLRGAGTAYRGAPERASADRRHRDRAEREPRHDGVPRRSGQPQRAHGPCRSRPVRRQADGTRHLDGCSPTGWRKQGGRPGPR